MVLEQTWHKLSRCKPTQKKVRGRTVCVVINKLELFFIFCIFAPFLFPSRRQSLIFGNVRRVGWIETRSLCNKVDS